MGCPVLGRARLACGLLSEKKNRGPNAQKEYRAALHQNPRTMSYISLGEGISPFASGTRVGLIF